MATAGPSTIHSFFVLRVLSGRQNVEEPPRCLFVERFKTPTAASRSPTNSDYLKVASELVLYLEASILPGLHPPATAGQTPLQAAAALHSGGVMGGVGRSRFKVLRGATFALHQYVSPTGIRFFLVTDPNFPTADGQKLLERIYTNFWIELVAKGDAVDLPRLCSQATQGVVQPDGSMEVEPALPHDVHMAFGSEVRQLFKSYAQGSLAAK
jgi:hypothetical protein